MVYLGHGVLQSQTQPAGEDLTGKFGYFGKSVNGKTFLAGNGEQCMGPIQNEGVVDDPIRTALTGVSAFVAGATIAADAFVTPDATGRGKTAATGHAIAGKNRFLVAVGEQGELIMGAAPTVP